jgi:hypothetical protein
MKLLNLFKKRVRKQENPIRYKYTATITFKNGLKVDVVGKYPSHTDFASQFVDLLEYREYFHSSKLNGDRIVIKTKNVESISVKENPLEDDYNEA